MDMVLDFLDPAILDGTYGWIRQKIEKDVCHASSHFPSSSYTRELLQQWTNHLCAVTGNSELWERDSMVRQAITIFTLTWSVSGFFFLFFGTICYFKNFDRSLKRHPKFQKSQIRAEIRDSLTALFWLNVFTVPIFLAQVRGYSRVYDFGTGDLWYEIAQYPFFVLFSDTCMYWMHRAFHNPVLFKLMHKKHHQYVVPTPFSAYAFDPLEAYIMSLPIYSYAFIWPMSNVAQLVVFFCTNIWTFLLHDSRSQFHTVHHKNVNFNFGQYLHLWDHLGGTYQEAGVMYTVKGLDEKK